MTSEVSSVISGVSNSTRSYEQITSPSSLAVGSPATSDGQSTLTARSDKTITATTELLNAGALPGDTLSLQISINHTKPIKSLHGIIVTFYRQGRIDTHPLLPIGPVGKGKRSSQDDYYPKSRTGLGGLSLSTAGSSSVFRKDLSQSFTPLIVDPRTLTASVKATVKVPEDVFPTIACVPGHIISFKYYVEAVIDLRGKLAGQDRFLPRLNMTSPPSTYGSGIHQLSGNNNDAFNQRAMFEGSIVNTEHIRREKSVVACLFEVIVGTKDSRRVRKQGLDGQERRSDGNNYSTNNYPDQQQGGDDWHDEMSTTEQDESGDYDNGDQLQSHQDQYVEDDSLNEPISPTQPLSPQRIPMPLTEEDEEGLDEKSRLRRAEERLLPSQPPEDDEDGPSRAPAEAPTAPTLHDQDSLEHDEYQYSTETAAPAYAHASPASLDLSHTTSTDTTRPETGGSRGTTRPYDEADGAEEDKQELERRRLMAQASAPPDEDANDEPTEDEIGASAPVLSEEDQYVHSPSGRGEGVGESLPRYQR